MADYTPLGIEKISKQASAPTVLVRCPRDGVVMRVVAWRVRRRDGSGETRRGNGRLPKSGEWALVQLDVECPACRRRAEGIVVEPRDPRVPTAV
jgi:hypothetical protein